MAALGKHTIEMGGAGIEVDCTLKSVFDHFLEDERERRQEDHLHRDTIYAKMGDLDRRVTKVETKIALYAVGAAALFNLAMTVINKVM